VRALQNNCFMRAAAIDGEHALLLPHLSLAQALHATANTGSLSCSKFWNGIEAQA
jgi:hypothetical protein